MADAADYDAVINILKELFVKTKNEIYNRHVLISRCQKESESLDEYIQELTKLSKECTFAAVSAAEYCSEYVRDAFLNGIRSREIRQRLLENSTLTRDEAFQKARALAMAQKQSEQYSHTLSSPIPPTSIASLTLGDDQEDDEPSDHLAAIPRRVGEGEKKETCYFCGYNRHPRSECPARDHICNICSITGHYERVCRSKDSTANRSRGRRRNRGNTKSAAAFSRPKLLAVAAARKGLSCDLTFTSTKVNGKQTDTLLDSGSDLSFISANVARRRNLHVFDSNREVELADEHTANVVGTAIVDIELNGKMYKGQEVHVLKKMFIGCIIGKDILKRHKSVVFHFGGLEEPIHINPTTSSSTTPTPPSSTAPSASPASTATMSIKDRFCPSTVNIGGTQLINLGAVLNKSDSLETMNIDPPPVFTNMSEDCKPIACKSRRHSKSDIDFIRSEKNRLLSEGIIEPSVSPWRAQVLVTSQPGKKRRMVIDYSQTVNIHTQQDAYPMPRIDDMVNEISTYKYFTTLDLKSAYHQLPLLPEERLYTAFEIDRELFQFTRVPFGITNGGAAFQRVMDNVIRTEKLLDTFAYADNVTVCGRTEEEHHYNLAEFKKAAGKYNMTFNIEKTCHFKTSITLLGYQVEHGSIKPDPQRLQPLIDLPPPHDPKSLKRVIGLFAYYSKWIRNFSEKIRPLSQSKAFPMTADAIETFNSLKAEVKASAVSSIDPDIPFVVETDASDYAIGATLNQDGRPVAFFSRTLNTSESGLHPVEKEAYAIVESIRGWRHFLLGRHFKVVTDQRSVAFMYEQRKRCKTKNDKIARWRVDLAEFSFDAVYRPGTENAAADTLSRNTCSAMNSNDEDLREKHDALCHPGITRFNHFVKSRNLPYSVNDVRKVIDSCEICAELKPRFHRFKGKLIKATQPLQQLNIDFKGPLPSAGPNKYLLTLVDEYSRFPFAFPCKDMKSSTVISCLEQFFAMFGMPSYVHNDRAPDFLLDEIKTYLKTRGIATSRTSRYNPQGNGQIERYNGTIWRTVMLALRSKQLPTTHWESVLPDALHSIRSLLCVSTNCTPHERFFNFQRRATAGNAVPTWLLNSGPVYVKRHGLNSKYEPRVEVADLIEANPEYAFVRFSSGREATVSLRDVAPYVGPRNDVTTGGAPADGTGDKMNSTTTGENTTHSDATPGATPHDGNSASTHTDSLDADNDTLLIPSESVQNLLPVQAELCRTLDGPRRSSHTVGAPDRFPDSVYSTGSIYYV